jgi:sulfide:quinone oxidoreductase
VRLPCGPLIRSNYGDHLSVFADGAGNVSAENYIVNERFPTGRPLHVLIAGGGVAGLEALLALKQHAEERVSIELLAMETQFWYRPLAVAEPFGLGRVHGLDLGSVADDCGALLTLGKLESVDSEGHVARTSAGAELAYDVLLIAVGARPVAAVPGAFTFRGPTDTDAFRSLLDKLAEGKARRIAFALHGAVSWPLPLYELALQTASLLARDRTPVDVVVVTHEEAPLQLFGPAASSAMAGLLADQQIQLRTSSYPVAFADGSLLLTPDAELEADWVVALPRLEAPVIAGIPGDTQGFVATDGSGRIHGIGDVFAAGDVTAFPVKQGGLAAQQADAAAEAIAVLAGAEFTAEPFRPVLRGLILTGGAPLFARVELGRAAAPSPISTDALWWPPGKIVGRYLAPFLGEHSDTILSPPAALEGVSVDTDLSSLTPAT